MKIISVIFIMNRLNNLINNCYVITLHKKKERYDNVIYNKQFIPKLHIFYAYEGNHMNINESSAWLPSKHESDISNTLMELVMYGKPLWTKFKLLYIT